MTRKFRRKILTNRGTRTVGFGKVGQHRKSGQTAGRGKTTQWKKSKKSYYLKQKELGFPDPDWDMGKKGFKRPQDLVRIYQVNTINVKDLDQRIDNLVLDKKAIKSGGSYTINLNEINIQKLLGKGDINKAINITVNKSSRKAMEKIKEAGGKITLLSQAE